MDPAKLREMDELSQMDQISQGPDERSFKNRIARSAAGSAGRKERIARNGLPKETKK